MKKRTIVGSLFVITFFTVLDRGLGFVFKIFISRVLGAEKMGIYQMAFSLFAVFLSAVTGGIPIVVSKFTARKIKEGKSADSIAAAAFWFSFSLSVVLSAGFLAVAPLINSLSATERLVVTLMLPSLVFSSVYCSLRGNLWGKEKFFLVSVVEVVEQIVRIGSCAAMFALGFEPLRSVAVSLSIGCLASALCCLVFFLACGGKPAKPDSDAPALLKSNAPLTLSRVINALFSSFTSFAVPWLFVMSGYTQSQANAMLGASLGMAMPLLFIPGTLVSSLAFVLIPHLGSMNVKTDKNQINKTVNGAITFAVIVSCAFIGFFSACAVPICKTIYNNEESGIFLRSVAWALLPMSVESITSSMMNSLDLEIRGFVNGIVGYVMLWLVAVVFWGKFTIDALGLGFALSWCLSAVLQIVSIRKKTGLGSGFLLPSVKAVLLCFPTATLAANVYGACSLVSPILGLLASFAAQAAFFCGACLLFGAVGISSIKAPRRKKTAQKA